MLDYFKVGYISRTCDKATQNYKQN